ncbi:MAG: HAD-IB family hydrolase [Acidimicrobiales bacterium]|jgi:HAD superfamily hydrolase (TIGR01490 family)|nr:HAD-IB family hydrolase [Acidimicrobiaceae bacterium]MDP6162535.1 HAD-IB family hydrolase [Acidimicrobiales bacterium]MDP6286065.1 HAD-IB family hydrolase [Acidimicrobiales bacterium]HJL90758.1 HAD-IB family hydrolase [Acidimicrobiales bacterium]HJO41187.1 HAD-IB family hydrolase [Acidimicrobiales bacterium]
MIKQNLSGKRIAITGATGFLGTALVERLLSSIPDCELVLLVRPGRRGAEKRAERDILRNDAFDNLREKLGNDGFKELCEKRVTAISGDVGVDGLGLDEDGLIQLAKCDLFIHSAAVVSFDSPLDQAVEVNLLGPVRIAQTLNELAVSPHLVSISTCYVAGSRRGAAPEEPVDSSPFFVDVDWKIEVDAARRTRQETETASRTPERLEGFRKEAREELGAAGIPALASKTEQLRSRWVNDRMAEAGRSRAHSLGFPDAYAYTKALGEIALRETADTIPVSIVRPSIIESALAEPFPGWIRGFRMAEPVIISYARGLLKDFPGIPEGTIDVIPVDMVTAAICAVAARGPAEQPDIVQIASGSINPLRYGHLFDMIRAWFTLHPVYDEIGQPIAVPGWDFPGISKVRKQLERGQTLLSKTQKVFDQLPIRGSRADVIAKLEEQRDQIEKALGYVDLYGAYVECQAIYGLESLLKLWDSLDEEDKDDFCFDPGIIDWNQYANEIHLPSVVKAGRVPMSPPSKKGPDRETRLRNQILSPDRHIAAFDLENTLIASNVVSSFAWLASRRLSRAERIRLVVKTLAEVPQLLSLDKQDRGDFLRHFYRRYEGAPISQISEDSAEQFSDLILSKSFPEGIRRVREHRNLGHKTVLITGALDFIVEPLKPLFDDIICPKLGHNGDSYDGRLVDVPPTGESRYQALADYAAANQLDLRESVAYADSASDLPMLEAVGFPVAVNPEVRLASIARKRGWLVEDFSKSPGISNKILPLAPHRGSKA